MAIQSLGEVIEVLGLSPNSSMRDVADHLGLSPEGLTLKDIIREVEKIEGHNSKVTSPPRIEP